MKITKNQLKQIIKEELSRVLDENVPNPEFRSKVASGEEERLSGQANLNWLNFGEGPRDESIIQTYIDEAAKAFEAAEGKSASDDLDAFIKWAHKSGNERAQQWEDQLAATREYVRSKTSRRR